MLQFFIVSIFDAPLRKNVVASPLYDDGLSGVGVVGAVDVTNGFIIIDICGTVQNSPELLRNGKLFGCCLLTRPSMPECIALLLSFMGGVSLSIS